MDYSFLREVAIWPVTKTLVEKLLKDLEGLNISDDSLADQWDDLCKQSSDLAPPREHLTVLEHFRQLACKVFGDTDGLSIEQNRFLAASVFAFIHEYNTWNIQHRLNFGEPNECVVEILSLRLYFFLRSEYLFDLDAQDQDFKETYTMLSTTNPDLMLSKLSVAGSENLPAKNTLH